MSPTSEEEELLKALFAPRETRCSWCLGDEVVRIVASGRERRRSWMAEAPVEEEPPTTYVEGR